MAHAATDLDTALQRVRTTCRGISNDLGRVKTSAGVGTATGAVGTVMGGVALGAGIAKSKTDKEISKWKQVLLDAAIAELQSGEQYETIAEGDLEVAWTAALGGSTKNDLIVVASGEVDKTVQGNISALEDKSKHLGNVRTGTLAVSTATNLAGALVSATDKSRGDLRERVSACIASVKELQVAYKDARTNGDMDIDTALRVDRIIDRCGQWKDVDIKKIGDVGTGATVASGIGAGTGLIGTITSGSANKKTADDGEGGEENAKKVKSLNTASNVLAGTTAVASGVSTVLQASRIGAINKAMSVAEECEGALK